MLQLLSPELVDKFNQDITELKNRLCTEVDDISRRYLDLFLAEVTARQTALCSDCEQCRNRASPIQSSTDQDHPNQFEDVPNQADAIDANESDEDEDDDYWGGLVMNMSNVIRQQMNEDVPTESDDNDDNEDVSSVAETQNDSVPANQADATQERPVDEPPKPKRQKIVWEEDKTDPIPNQKPFSPIISDSEPEPSRIARRTVRIKPRTNQQIQEDEDIDWSYTGPLTRPSPSTISRHQNVIQEIESFEDQIASSFADESAANNGDSRQSTDPETSLHVDESLFVHIGQNTEERLIQMAEPDELEQDSMTRAAKSFQGSVHSRLGAVYNDTDGKSVARILQLDCPVGNRCSTSFKTELQLKQHLIMAHRLGSYPCPMMECGGNGADESVSFESKNNLIRHFNESHPDRSAWRCSKCAHRVERPLDLLTHHANHHHRGQFECASGRCGHRSTTRHEALRHYRDQHARRSQK